MMTTTRIAATLGYAAAAIGVLLTVPALAGPAQEGVKAAEAARLRAELAHDMAALDTELADDLWYAHASGLIEDKAAHLRGVAGDGGHVVDARLVVQTIEVSGNLAVTRGTIDYFTKPDTTVPRRARYMSVYRQVNGHWLLAAWSNLPVKQGS